MFNYELNHGTFETVLYTSSTDLTRNAKTQSHTQSILHVDSLYYLRKKKYILQVKDKNKVINPIN